MKNQGDRASAVRLCLTGEDRFFVAVVLDLYSRRVVGWSMQPTMTAQLVMDALLIMEVSMTLGENQSAFKP